MRIGQVSDLRRDGLGHLLPAEADIHATEPGEGVEIGLPVRIRQLITTGGPLRSCSARWRNFRTFVRADCSNGNRLSGSGASPRA